MPPKCKFTKEEIINTALEITREKGISALTARSLAERLGCSVKPVFGLFESMEQVKTEVLCAANSIYQSYLYEDIKAEKYPPYKSSGMAYIRFAKEEKELFKLLYMRDRTGEKVEEDREAVRPQLEMIKHSLGISDDEAYLLHIEMWIFVHGIATMIATDYLNWDMEFISRVLTDEYNGLKAKYMKEG